ncbi:type II toxin-antitoxin system RelE/ParE family toxin [Campylobacter concisus]|uniref:type II toxin-antitoxin system RelE/ParE family toxin n=1 Tax=Campylobacter concisus TaxID=199 RepID=UPI000CD8A1A8|nr:type II toxin-antitoxin system RelE/ParE family toxin [Campylobacter concisus]
MKLLLSKRFQSDLEKILIFYSQKSFEASENFYNSLFDKMKSIEFMPYRFRKNRYFHKDNVRDLIFNGYVIPFIIDDKTITILAIYKQNLPKF